MASDTAHMERLDKGEGSGDSQYSDCEEQVRETTGNDKSEGNAVTNDTSSTDDYREDTTQRSDDENIGENCDVNAQSKVENSGKNGDEKVQDDNFGLVRDSSQISTTDHNTKNLDTSLTCDSETVEHSSEINIETDSLNSVGDLSADDHSSDILNAHANMVKNEEEKKGDGVVSEVKPGDDIAETDKTNEKQKSDSDLSKSDSQSNASLDQASNDADSAKNTSQPKQDSKQKSDSKQKKESNKKSDSLATKLKSKITKKTDSSKKPEKGKSSETSDKPKSDKKLDKKDKKSVKSKLASLKSDVSKGISAVKSSDSKSRKDASKRNSSNKELVPEAPQNVSEETKTASDETISVSDTPDPASDVAKSEQETVKADSEEPVVSNETNSVVSNSISEETVPQTEDSTAVSDGDKSDLEQNESKQDTADELVADENENKNIPNENSSLEKEVTQEKDISEENAGKDPTQSSNESENRELSEHGDKEVHGSNENKSGKPSKDGKPKIVVHRGGSEDHGDVDISMAEFGSLSKQAEQRLAARRAAREEARLIRMKELERQQREMEEKQDRIYELTRDSGARGFSTSRRGSDDSTSSEDTRELKKQLAELEERYKKAMMNNAQLDNEKQKFRYEVDILKDKYEEIEENHIEIQREHRDRCRELEQKKRDLNDLQIEVEYLKLQITQRDKLIQEYGLVFVSNETVEDENDKKKKRRKRKKEEQEKDTAALVTPDALTVLGKVQGNLDERLKSLADNQLKMEEEMKKLRIELDEERAKNVLSEKYNSPKSHKDSGMNGPSSDGVAHEANMEAQKQLTEYRYKLKKAEQDITVLEGNVIRLESQVKRYKGAADEGEKTIEEMKLDKRKLQRDLRDAQYKVEELNSQNQNLQTRIKTLKQERIDSIISGKS